MKFLSLLVLLPAIGLNAHAATKTAYQITCDGALKMSAVFTVRGSFPMLDSYNDATLQVLSLQRVTANGAVDLNYTKDVLSTVVPVVPEGEAAGLIDILLDAPDGYNQFSLQILPVNWGALGEPAPSDNMNLAASRISLIDRKTDEELSANCEVRYKK